MLSETTVAYESRGSSTARSAIFPRLLLAAVALVIALFCIEIPALVGIVDYRTMIGPTHAWWGPNIFDRELGHIHRPHAHQSGSSLGGDAAAAYQIPASDKTLFRWNTRFDQNGFRNESDLQSADMVMIGDSFIEGMTVPSEQLTTSLLAHLQGETVANLGQAAYGPLQELVVLRRYGLRLRPRTVIWMFSEASDLGDVITYQHWTAPSLWRAFFERSFTKSAIHEIRYLASPPTKRPGTRRSAVLQTLKARRSRFISWLLPGPLRNRI